MALQNVKVISSIERPKLITGGRLVQVVVITLETSLGNTGTLEIPVNQAEALTDDELAEKIAQKAMMLDRASLL